MAAPGFSDAAHPAREMGTRPMTGSPLEAGEPEIGRIPKSLSAARRMAGGAA
jgi:hypothetical protein